MGLVRMHYKRKPGRAAAALWPVTLHSVVSEEEGSNSKEDQDEHFGALFEGYGRADGAQI